jgi:predicted phage baseplate assembly protein
MTRKVCGCSVSTCGCCEGTQPVTPVDTTNRPGLDALSYRIGTHGAFLETMKARLCNVTVTAPGPDGQTDQTFQPLQGLTTRNSNDPAIALLDGWATVADVLTFYQERIANEGYLRTATERRSVLELARLVGYALRPGVAATVYLAYTLDDNQTTPVTIPPGARSQSIPGPDELPQSFETSDPLLTHTEWSNLQIRTTRPQVVTLDNAVSLETIWVDGTDTKLKTGDLLLFVFDDDGDPSVIRTVASIDAQFEQKRTLVRLHLRAPHYGDAVAALRKFVIAAEKVEFPSVSSSAREAVAVTVPLLERAERLLQQAYLESAPPFDEWVDVLIPIESNVPPELQPFFDIFTAEMDAITGKSPSPPPPVVTDPSQFTESLLKPLVTQFASSLQLPRSLAAAFRPGADVQPQLLVRFAPQLRDTFYVAWANAQVSAKSPELAGVFALRTTAPLFGSSVPLIPQYDDSGKLEPQNQWVDWDTSNESATALSLDQPHPEVLPQSYALIQTGTTQVTRQVQKVADAKTSQRSDYGITGPTTRLEFADAWQVTPDKLTPLRAILVRAQSEPLTLIDEPVLTDVAGQEIDLQQLHKELTSGRWIILSGERTDIPGVSGVQGTELLMISGLRQDFDATVPGDKVRTTLLLATKMAYSYRRDKLTVYGNVVKATHGETKVETLGAGDATQPFQTFTLKQPPLTWTPAPTPSGVNSTLHVYVNGIEWHETDTLAGLGPKSRSFITKTDDKGQTSVIFGNGDEGARLPTGVENVGAVYRSGIGQPGNVKAGQISTLQTRPLGVKSVLNPLPSSGGADKESRDQARQNAPLAVMSLDRLVSIEDYSDFTRTFAGIGKAAARKLTNGRQLLAHITIAGADDIPIDKTSDLYRNLLTALQSYGDVSLPVQVDARELVVLVLSARIRLDPDYLWDPVAAKITSNLLAAYGFRNRDLGEPALLCEIVALIQNTEGVVYVDVDAFGGIPEKTSGPDGSRRLLTLDEMTRAVQAITGAADSTRDGVPAQRVDVNLADFDNGGIHPAQLAIFTPAAPETIVLNQIL